MSKEMKSLILKELKESFGDLDECIVVGLQGITVENSNQLRSNLRDSGARMMVVKNRLARLAMQEIEKEPISELLEGPSAVVFGDEGIVPIAKVLKTWTKQNRDVFIKGGFLEENVLTSAEVGRLSTIPGRDVLLSQVLSGISAPATSFLNLLTAKFREFMQCLNALKEKVGEKEG